MRFLPVLVAVGLIPLLSAPLAAQTDYRGKSTNMLTVGLGFSGGASLISAPPEGAKVKPIFAWRLTADGSYPLNPTVGAQMSLGIDSRGTRLHQFEHPDQYVDTRVSYFVLTPGFKFSAFTLSFNIGLPMSGTFSTSAGSEDIPSEAWDKVEVLLEPRLGALIPLVEEPIGWLGLTLDAGYALNEMFETEGVTNGQDGHLITGHMGLTWQFGIQGTGR